MRMRTLHTVAMSLTLVIGGCTAATGEESMDDELDGLEEVQSQAATVDQRPVPARVALLDNDALARSVQHVRNSGSFSRPNGAIGCSLAGGSKRGVDQRAELAVASVARDDEFTFGMTLRDFRGGAKVWQVIGPPYNGDPISMSAGADFTLKGGNKMMKLGPVGTSPTTFVFAVKAGVNGYIRTWRDGVYKGELASDLNRGQSQSRLRIGRYNRGGEDSAASGVYDEVWVTGLSNLMPGRPTNR